jgi:hypothetical protein
MIVIPIGITNLLLFVFTLLIIPIQLRSSKISPLKADRHLKNDIAMRGYGEGSPSNFDEFDF